MPTKILMPALSPTMKEGNLVKWLKKEGDMIEAGEVIAEIETDKATMEVEAVDEGKLAKIVVPAGSESVAVNAVIAILLEEGEDQSALDEVDLELESQNRSKTEVVEQEIPSKSKENKKGSVEESTHAEKAKENNLGKRIFASPLAKRLAVEKGVNLAALQGSGPHGRVIKIDIENARPGETSMALGSTIGSTISTRSEGLPPFDEIKLTNIRKVIAQRLTEAKQTVPHFYLTISCNIDKLLDVRQDINMSLTDEKISVNDMVVRACALALRDVPDANISWADDHLKRYQSSDISVAVAIKDGLITPIVRDAQLKSVVQISREMKDLISRAREGKLKPEEFQGGTMSLSNLGMFGIQEFGAIINPPQGCILAVGAGEKRPVVIDEDLAVATMMTCTLSVDHRAIDGAVGSELLKAFKSYIETPIRLIL